MSLYRLSLDRSCLLPLELFRHSYFSFIGDTQLASWQLIADAMLAQRFPRLARGSSAAGISFVGGGSAAINAAWGTWVKSYILRPRARICYVHPSSLEHVRALQCWLLGWLTIRPTVWLAAGAGRKLMGDARKTVKDSSSSRERERRKMHEREGETWWP